MSASDARPIPRKNVAFRVTFPIFDADGDLVSGAANLDSEVSKDGAAFADCASEATEIATNSGMYFLDLSADEMNADTVAIIVKTSTSGAKTTPIVLYPEEAGDVRVDMVQISGDSAAADNAESFFDGNGYAGTGNTIPTVTNITNGVTVSANNDKTGYRLSATGVDDILDEAITEPASVFTWAGASLRTIIGWLGALNRNKITQTSAVQTLRNDADNANLGTASVSDDGTTATRAEWS